MLTEEMKRKNAEKILRDDILWTVKYGPGFDPCSGAHREKKKWISGGIYSASNCGTCAIGAVCLRRQPKLTGGKFVPEARAAAKILGLTAKEVQQIYYAVAGDISEERPNSYERVYFPEWVIEMAGRLVEYGESLDMEELRHEAGQEDQKFAEKMGWA